MNRPTDAQLALLRHTLGLSERVREPYRNFFAAGASHDDRANLLELEAAGLMTRRPLAEHFGGGDCFHASDAGRALAIASLPPVRKRSKYEEYLDVAECYESFAAFLGIEAPRREYSYRSTGNGRRTVIRLTSRRGTGEYCATLKEAKASYKAALKAHQQAEREWNAA